MNSVKGYPEVGKMFRAKDNVPSIEKPDRLKFERGDTITVVGVGPPTLANEIGRFVVESYRGRTMLTFERFGEFFERLS